MPASIFAYLSCGDNNGDIKPKPQKDTIPNIIKPLSTAVKPFELVTLSTNSLVFQDTGKYFAKIGTAQVQLYFVSANKLTFIFPKLTAGNYKMIANIRDSIFSTSFNVSDYNAIENPKQFLSQWLDVETGDYKRLEALMDTLTVRKISEASKLKADYLIMRPKFDEVLNNFDQMSDDRQQAVVGFILNNYSNYKTLNDSISRLTKLINELDTAKIVTARRSAKMSYLTSQYVKLIPEFKNVTASYNAIEVITSKIKVDLPEIKLAGAMKHKHWIDMAATTLFLNTEPFYPTTAKITSPDNSFSFQINTPKNVTLRLNIRNFQKAKDEISSVVWIKDYASAMNGFYEYWKLNKPSTISAVPYFVENYRKDVFAESLDYVKIKVLNNDNVYSKVLGTPSNCQFSFSSQVASNQLFQFEVVYNDGETILVTNTVDAVVKPNCVDIIINSQTAVNATCYGANNGSILLNVTGGIGQLRYSLDSINYSNANRFDNLSPNNYVVIIKDENGCKTRTNVLMVGEPTKVKIDMVKAKNVSSHAINDGEIEIIASGGTLPLNYSRNNGSSYQTDNKFMNLVPDSYQIVVRDQNKCNTTLDSVVVIKKDANPAGLLRDSRDNQQYETVKIGELWWMAENLNYETSNSSCYNLQKTNCDLYGRLYTWDAAVNACPTGWHLPTDDEWKNLEMELELTPSEANLTGYRGDYLKDLLLPKGGSGFNLLWAGTWSNSYINLGSQAYFWTQTLSGTKAWHRGLSVDQRGINRQDRIATNGYSIRCVQNAVK